MTEHTNLWVRLPDDLSPEELREMKRKILTGEIPLRLVSEETTTKRVYEPDERHEDTG